MKLAIFPLATILIAAAPADDAFDQAVGALAAGSRAIAAGNLPRLRTAARDLRASAATPLAGDDLAASWLRKAHAVAPPPERDRALGPGYRSLDLDGGGTALFEQTFLAGQRARVTIVPAGRAEFALRVSDGGRETVCSASPKKARCDWVPSFTARFRIEVANPGHRTGRYFLVLQ